MSFTIWSFAAADAIAVFTIAPLRRGHEQRPFLLHSASYILRMYERTRRPYNVRLGPVLAERARALGCPDLTSPPRLSSRLATPACPPAAEPPRSYAYAAPYADPVFSQFQFPSHCISAFRARKVSSQGLQMSTLFWASRGISRKLNHPLWSGWPRSVGIWIVTPSALLRRRAAPVLFAPARPPDLQMITLFWALRGGSARSLVSETQRAIRSSAHFVHPNRRAYRPRSVWSTCSAAPPPVPEAVGSPFKERLTTVGWDEDSDSDRELSTKRGHSLGVYAALCYNHDHAPAREKSARTSVEPADSDVSAAHAHGAAPGDPCHILYARARNRTAARGAALSPRRAARRRELQRLILILVGPGIRYRGVNSPPKSARALGCEDVAAPDAHARGRLLRGLRAVRTQAARAHRGEAREATQDGGGGGSSAPGGGERVDEREGAQRREGAEGVREDGYGGMEGRTGGRSTQGVDRRPGHAVRSAATSAAADAKMSGRSRRESAESARGQERHGETYEGDRRRDAERLDYLRARDVLEVVERPDERHERGDALEREESVGGVEKGGARDRKPKKMRWSSSEAKLHRHFGSFLSPS
ncbi:hypothetical protein FB451DRAFT_1172486 [Mycena latifolia]|nr:hypothetical protein FB451DRAFT_1172486 [Mycena latifolia]